VRHVSGTVFALQSTRRRRPDASAATATAQKPAVVSTPQWPQLLVANASVAVIPGLGRGVTRRAMQLVESDCRVRRGRSCTNRVLQKRKGNLVVAQEGAAVLTAVSHPRTCVADCVSFCA